jgi:hypothetical protein
MTAKQNYVSNELTHFLGRGIRAATPKKTRQGQYELLLKILREGQLSCREGSGGAIVIDPFAGFSSNRMIRPDGVCFCDIPLSSLAIHMRKYSQFGLAFPRPFLLQQGANPVFYVAGTATVRLWNLAGKRAEFHAEQRSTHFDKQFAEFYDCLREVKRYVHVRRADLMQPDPLVQRLEKVEAFLASVFGYFKCFDATTTEDDEENYYMEREWRLRMNLKFEITDVRRVILPCAFAKRFKSDVPGFAGVEQRIAAGVTSIRSRWACGR